MSYYIHDVPGRLRVKSPIIKRNQYAANEVERLLETVDGVDMININLLTGSLLVNYNPKITKYHDIVNLLQNEGYFDHSKAITNDQYIHNAASKVSELALSVFTSLV
jgi:copper chaperone CopZ